MKFPSHIYSATITQVYDGDTITADIDLGFHTVIKDQKIRLFGINTPEVRGPERDQGIKVRDWLRLQILNKPVVLHTFKDRRDNEKKGKYGRWLADVYTMNGVYINQLIIDEEMGEERDY